MTKEKIGKQRIQDILGDRSTKIIEHFESISPDFAKYIVDFVYGDLYARKNFSDKNRELAAVACMIGRGQTGLPIKAHLKGMLNVGWTKDEIIELIIFLSAYAGFPSTVEVLGTLKEVLAQN
ncbi:MAG: carboxymuconolactone decarboxylase family protein [Alphaproteobacteria bacterium]|nr:carboxymuconolactone decarboxylase family protein [Alphaproteobacteria bacterium]